MDVSLPLAKFAACSNIFIKMLFFKRGQVERGHKHCYDHLSLLARGAVVVKVNGQETTFTAPHIVFVSKDHEHEITALEDNTTWFCIHALRNADNTEIVEEDTVPLGVNNAIAFTNLLADEQKIYSRLTSQSHVPLSDEQKEYYAYVRERELLGILNGDIQISKPQGSV